MSLIAQSLLDEKAVFLRPEEPFTWTSGIKSPIYCDNRMLISAPQARSLIVDQFVHLIQEQKLDPEIIAGTATAGIPWAAWIADRLRLPMVYVRSSAKDHGRKNLIEGKITPSDRVLLIEDLISTGKSSLAAAQNLEDNQMKVLAVLGLFHYNFPMAHKTFSHKGLPVHALCTLDQLLEFASTTKKISEEQRKDILSWRQNTQIP
jgi:orotate phosphoribosyltransferase